MSANLDMSLGEIISNRKTAPRGRGRARGKTTATTPTNGIRKNVATRSQAKPAAKPTGPAPSLKGNSKIIVSGLVCVTSICFSALLIRYSPPMSTRPRSRYVKTQATSLGFLSPTLLRMSNYMETARVLRGVVIVTFRHTWTF